MANILIVDDDLAFSGAVAELLESQGHRVSILRDPDATLPHIAEHSADIAILDVMFPEDPTAGFDLAHEIRRAYPEMRIMLLTAINQKSPLGFSGKSFRLNDLPVDDFLCWLP